ncbi:MAG: FAD-dependent monooxygenase [Aquabacterium sp.]|nr:FAD-dependent monooxygenase [Aquabacterium sp.]
MSNLEVCVRGNGAVGLTLALALARQGLRIGVVGATPGATALPDVRAYALNAASRRLLGELRVWDALPADAVTPVDEMRIEGDAPGGAIQFSAWQQGCEALAWIVDAAELEAALRTAARFAPHLTVLPDEAAVGLGTGAQDPTGRLLHLDAQPVHAQGEQGRGHVVEQRRSDRVDVLVRSAPQAVDELLHVGNLLLELPETVPCRRYVAMSSNATAAPTPTSAPVGSAMPRRKGSARNSPPSPSM